MVIRWNEISGNDKCPKVHIRMRIQICLHDNGTSTHSILNETKINTIYNLQFKKNNINIIKYIKKFNYYEKLANFLKFIVILQKINTH